MLNELPNIFFQFFSLFLFVSFFFPDARRRSHKFITFVAGSRLILGLEVEFDPCNALLSGARDHEVGFRVAEIFIKKRQGHLLQKKGKEAEHVLQKDSKDCQKYLFFMIIHLFFEFPVDFVFGVIDELRKVSRLCD